MSADAGQFQGQFFLPAGTWSSVLDNPVAGVATLLLTEAARLDDWKLDEWLGMFAAECVYWVPVTFAVQDPTAQVNLIFDNRELLEDRVFRLQTGQVPSQDPPSRTLRGLTGVMTAPTGQPGEVLTQSTFWLREHRPRASREYCGRSIHRLHQTANGWEIAGKKVCLLNSDDPLPSLTFLL